MLTLACKKEHLFLSTPCSGCFLQSLFNSGYCENFKRNYFEEHLHTAASENVLMK